MHRFNYVIFDLDGTLLDTSEGILEAIKDTITHFGLKMPSESDMRKFIGPPIQDAFKSYFSLEKEEADNMASNFRESYKNVHLFKAKPYPGIYDLLSKLRDNLIYTAVATNKRIDYATKLLEFYKFNPLFDFIGGSDFAQKLKKKDIIRMAINSIDSDIDLKPVMIGDSIGDYNGAISASVPFIGVTYGFGFENKRDVSVLEKVDFVADSVSELEEFLCEEI